MGKERLSDAQIMINYIKTMYRFTGKIGLTPNSIYFKDIELTDAFRNKGKLNGAHHAYRIFDDGNQSRCGTSEISRCSTPRIKDNSLFYGKHMQQVT